MLAAAAGHSRSLAQMDNTSHMCGMICLMLYMRGSACGARGSANMMSSSRAHVYSRQHGAIHGCCDKPR
jgi:hypothetical protein